MKVLVLGGTRYFGKRLVSSLISKDFDVTIATRGLTKDNFGTSLKRAKFDREQPGALNKLAQLEKWDIVYDQICYTSNDAIAACHAFNGRVGKYVHTSTGSVYTTDGTRVESDFDPYHYPIVYGDRKDFDYGEGKRQAEAVFFQKANFPVVAMRIPIVLGPDDYTGRLEFHIVHVANNKPIVIENLEANTSFISSEEAANFLSWLGLNNFTGPINGCSSGEISIQEVIKLIENTLKKKAIISKQGSEENVTPFVGPTSTIISNNLALKEGHSFQPLNSWLPKLIEELSYSRNL